MVSSVVFIILVWQLFGLLHWGACDGSATQAQPPIQVAGVPQFVLDYGKNTSRAGVKIKKKQD